jgi:hypothetical protein
VIGDELTAKLEDQEHREETLRELLERFESVQSTRPAFREPARDDEQTTKLRSEVDSIRDDLRVLVNQVGGLPVRSHRMKTGKVSIQKSCPLCSEMLTYTQKQKPTSVKSLMCTNCRASLYSQQINGEFVMKQRVPVIEVIECPVCTSKIEFKLDPVPGAVGDVECNSCKTPIRAIRRANGMKVKAMEGQVAPSKVVEERIKQVMGPQPWPAGRARVVAEQLGLSRQTVSSVIRRLIDQGIFKVQIDGKLYSTDSASGVR